MRFALALSLAITLAALIFRDAHADGPLTLEARESIATEIRETLDSYREAMLTRDYDTMAAFWSTSDDFVMAGEGRILGGSDAWIDSMDEYYRIYDKYYVWDWQGVHILPLSQESAVATLEFRFRWHTVDEETMNSRGSWTYVFRKESEGWKVVHSNGTHVPL